jgi:hypothetical protein
VLKHGILVSLGVNGQTSWQQVDTNGKGTFDFGEFVAFSLHLPRMANVEHPFDTLETYWTYCLNFTIKYFDILCKSQKCKGHVGTQVHCCNVENIVRK